MPYSVTLTKCGGGAITNAVIGNGRCYGRTGNTYAFDSCNAVAACAGNSAVVSVTANPTTLPASGGTSTFTIEAYGYAGLTGTKSKSGGSSSTSWSGTVNIGDFTCPTTGTVNLTADANTSTSSDVYYTLTVGDQSAVVTQSHDSPPSSRKIDVIYDNQYTSRNLGNGSCVSFAIVLDFTYTNSSGSRVTYTGSGLVSHTNLTPGVNYVYSPSTGAKATLNDASTEAFTINISAFYVMDSACAMGSNNPAVTITADSTISIPAGTSVVTIVWTCSGELQFTYNT